MAEETTYRYGPLERGGVMLGLRVPQLVGFVVAGLIGLGFLNQANFVGLLLAVATLAAAAGSCSCRSAGTPSRSGRR